MHRSRSAAAFTITEMLFVLLFLGVAGTMSMRLFTTSMRVISSAPAEQDHLATVDRMSDAIRHDVWNAARVDIENASSVNLAFNDGTTVHLAVGNGEIVRTTLPPGQERRWKMPVALTAERQGPCLVLKSAKSDEGLCFVSQVLKLAEDKP
jgi:hypothetical protein